MTGPELIQLGLAAAVAGRLLDVDVGIQETGKVFRRMLITRPMLLLLMMIRVHLLLIVIPIAGRRFRWMRSTISRRSVRAGF